MSEKARCTAKVQIFNLKFNNNAFETFKLKKLMYSKQIIAIIILMTLSFTSANAGKSEKITLGAGCFWCVEAVFQRVNGVLKVESGYSGGAIANPTYMEVTSGLTGHAEVIQLTFDPEKVSLAKILEIFWKTHDPTTLNRQGADVGTQYRSAIFFHNENQRIVAEQLKAQLNQAQIWDKPIVTEITAFKAFYKAEDYHQNYYNENSNQSYCQFVIVPKLKKFEQLFQDYKTK
ncbi:MAG: peptide-methionine (S)-S-oxide reductase [Bacteroidetes bacterium]|nr:MAG: peptide-methionine (S)-S-oxide reductase [Bacteroidota bacterium]